MNTPKLLKTKSGLIISMLILLVILIAILLIIKQSNRIYDDDWVLTVNGESVSVGEFLNIRSGLRASVFSYFSQKFGAIDSKDFWKHEFNGEVPVEVLNKKTLEVLKRIKVEQILMKNYGLISDISYLEFIRNLDKENQRRKIAVERDIPIYGPQHYDERIFYEYLHSDRTEKLKQILYGENLFVSEEGKRIFYNENKYDKYRIPATIEIEVLTMNLTDEYAKIPSDEQGRIESSLKQNMKRIQGGEKSETVINEMKSVGIKSITLEKLYLNDETVIVGSELSPEMINEIRNLKFDQISETFNDGKTLKVFRIIEKTSEYYLAFNEVKDQIEKELLNNKYGSLINNIIDSASVDINEKILRKISR